MTSSEKPLLKIKADVKGGAGKENVGRQRRARLPILVIKPPEGKTFAGVRSKIRFSFKPEDSGVEVFSIRKMKVGGVLVELDPRTTDKGTLREAVEGLLGEKVFVSSLDPMCSLEI